MDEAKAAVRLTLDQVKAFLAQENPPRLSEADTKANFIEPIISALGWSGIGVVTREYYVRNSQEFIDYVMSTPTGPLLAIETKALQADLTDKFAAQLIQYCSVEGIEWAALTNGRELQFFNTFLKPDLAAKRILRIDLLAFNSDAEYDALFQQVWQLSRESMTTPTGVRTWLNQRRLDTALRSILLNPTSPTVRQLRRSLDDADVKATPQDIVQWFRTHLGSPITVLPVPSSRTSSQNPVVTTTANTLSGDGSSIIESDRAATTFEPAKAPIFAGGRGTLLPMFQSLEQVVDQRWLDTIWRTLKHYVAAEVQGRTFLAVKCRGHRLVIGLTLPIHTSSPILSENAGQFNWARMTKVAQLESLADIGDALLSVIGKARAYASGSPTSQRYYGISLGDLITAGLLQPGTPLTLVAKGKRDVARATLSPDGAIIWQGQTYRSPSDLAFAPLLGVTKFNGWQYWHAELAQGRQTLAEVRALMLTNSSSAEDVVVRDTG